MRSSDLIYEARRRAGITQAELGGRLGRSQSQVARWERGAAKPTFETLREIVRACDLELTVGLAQHDDSYAPSIARALGLTPRERVERAVRAGRTLARVRTAVESARRG
jgi:transcriptional regulator with XRE-family HTH domain